MRVFLALFILHSFGFASSTSSSSTTSCFSQLFKDINIFQAKVTDTLDPLWLENRKHPKICADFVKNAMKAGSPERGSFKHVQLRLDSIFESADLDKKHMFFRAFPDAYYYELSSNKSLLQNLNTIKDYKGLILGDVHVENFGIIKVNKRNKINYNLMVNDFDEVGNGPYYSDVLRLISSAKLAEKNLKPRVINDKLGCMLEVYQAALSGQNTACQGVTIPTSRVDKRSSKSKEDYEASFNDVSLDSMSNPCEEISQNELEYFTAQIPDSYMKNALSSKQRCKKTGGSGFLRSAQYIETERVNNRVRNMIMETKTVSKKSAVYQYASTENEDHSSHIQKSLKLYGLEETIKLSGEETKFISREKDGGNKSYRPYKVGKEDKLERTIEMLYDQFFTLGWMHKKSLDDNDEKVKSGYIKNLKTIEKRGWDDESNQIVDSFENYYIACSPKP